MAACNLIQPLDPTLQAAWFTADQNDDFGITVGDGAVVVSAPTSNVGGNGRVAFWPADGSPSLDHQSCVSWVEGSHFTQQGVTLRTRTVAGRTSAITVTKNIYAGWYWFLNVIVMDSGAETPLLKIGAVSAVDAMLHRRRGHTRTVDPVRPVVGDEVDIKMWAVDQAEPPWGTDGYGGHVTLPDLPGLDLPGCRAGTWATCAPATRRATSTARSPTSARPSRRRRPRPSRRLGSTTTTEPPTGSTITTEPTTTTEPPATPPDPPAP